MNGVVLDTRAKRPRTEDETQAMATRGLDAQDAPDTNHWHMSSGRFPLPTELVLEIISRLSDDAQDVCGADIEDEKQYDARQSALRALSQTSQMLRAICLPLLWERIDLHERGRWTGEDWAEALCTRLDRIATGLITNPTLAAYVRFVFCHFSSVLEKKNRTNVLTLAATPHIFSVFDVIILTDSAGLIFKLVTCLSLLPNLHTLCLHVRCDQSAIYSGFSRASFPQVRTLLISACHAETLVPCCPQVRTVISKTRVIGWSDLVGLFDNSSDTLEVLDGFCMNWETIGCESPLFPFCVPEHTHLERPIHRPCRHHP